MNRTEKNLLAFLFGMTFVIALAFFAVSAYAADAQVSWTLPTQRTDGSPLPASEIQHIRIEYGACLNGTLPSVMGTAEVPPPATGTTITGNFNYEWCFRGVTVDTAGQESDPSNIAIKDFGPPAPPNPPGNFAVAGAVAYEVKYMGPDWDVRTDLGREIGMVTRTVECGEYEWAAGGYYQVPADAVEFSRIPKSSVVIAKCETSGS